jgi:methionine-gamma-lyase
MKPPRKPLSRKTTAIHADRDDAQSSSAAPLLWQTATFTAGSAEEFAEAATEPRHDQFYTRYGNPTLTQASSVIAALEGTESAMLFASGMAAITTTVLALVKQGDHVVAQRSHYSSTLTLLNKVLPRFGVDVTLVDQTDTAAFEAAITPSTKLIYIESPTNPLMQLTDLAAVGALARKHGALIAIDNTFATPINQRPADHGIDLVLHSATKYMGGHSDLVAGALAGSSALLDRIWDFGLVMGGSLDPFAGWLLLRGLRTMPLRVEQQNRTGMAVAKFLSEHPSVKRVYYPGLASHPQHELAARQMQGFGGMLSFELEAGFDAAERLVTRLELASRAASLGGVETLIVHPAAMWKHSMTDEQLREAGVSPGLLRLSVGIEDQVDLIDDLAHALASDE